MSEPRLPSRRILIVDDTPATGYLLGRLLESMGQQVKSVHDAQAALEAMKVETPELVISDLSMPVMDGYEFARHVRADASFAGVFLVALSGLSSDEDRERADAVGFDRFLVKPVGVSELRDFLRANPEATRTYGELKKQIAEMHRNDIDRYIDGKTDFLLEILGQSELASSEPELIGAANRVTGGIRC